MHKGGYACGAVRFPFDHEVGGFCACHCSQCRRLSGMFWAGYPVPAEKITCGAQSGPRWYASSGVAERGFFGTRGASLFYRAHGGPYEVAPGALDGPVGAMIAGHIFVGNKGDYYRVTDGLPQYEGSAPGD